MIITFTVLAILFYLRHKVKSIWNKGHCKYIIGTFCIFIASIYLFTASYPLRSPPHLQFGASSNSSSSSKGPKRIATAKVAPGKHVNPLEGAAPSRQPQTASFQSSSNSSLGNSTYANTTDSPISKSPRGLNSTELSPEHEAVNSSITLVLEQINQKLSNFSQCAVITVSKVHSAILQSVGISSKKSNGNAVPARENGLTPMTVLIQNIPSSSHRDGNFQTSGMIDQASGETPANSVQEIRDGSSRLEAPVQQFQKGDNAGRTLHVSFSTAPGNRTLDAVLRGHGSNKWTLIGDATLRGDYSDRGHCTLSKIKINSALRPLCFCKNQ